MRKVRVNYFFFTNFCFKLDDFNFCINDRPIHIFQNITVL